MGIFDSTIKFVTTNAIPLGAAVLATAGGVGAYMYRGQIKKGVRSVGSKLGVSGKPAARANRKRKPSAEKKNQRAVEKIAEGLARQAEKELLAADKKLSKKAAQTEAERILAVARAEAAKIKADTDAIVAEALSVIEKAERTGANPTAPDETQGHVMTRKAPGHAMTIPKNKRAKSAKSVESKAA
jgi:nucleotide-binding universal stress UspA family protein